MLKEEYDQYIVLPNRFSPAVRVFTKVLTPLITHYCWERPLRFVFEDIRATVALFWELGFTIHPEKSFLVPIQQIIFVGFVIDSVKMTKTLTEERKQSIYTLYQNILSNY